MYTHTHTQYWAGGGGGGGKKKKQFTPSKEITINIHSG